MIRPRPVRLCDGRIVMNVSKTIMLTVLVIFMTMLAGQAMRKNR